jgi:putative transposase
LRDLKIENVNHVWEKDITYITMEKGFMYIATVIDVYSNLVLRWKISDTNLEIIDIKAIEKFA